MATTLLLATTAPVAFAQEEEDSLLVEWKCVPAQDRDATRITIGSSLYYKREYGGALYTVEELWQETNTDAGLQLNAGMSCVGQADRFVRAACIGICPVTF